jgi:hypothetical protein
VLRHRRVKFARVLCVVVLGLVLASCSGEPNASPQTSNETSGTATATAEEDSPFADPSAFDAVWEGWSEERRFAYCKDRHTKTAMAWLTGDFVEETGLRLRFDDALAATKEVCLETLRERMNFAIARDATRPVCQGLADGFERIRTDAEAQRRASSVASDPRAARVFVSTHAWARKAPHHSRTMRFEIREQVGPLARAVMGGAPRSAEREYVAKFLRACRLAHLEASTSLTARQADRAVTRLRTAARNAPWWPLGYTKLTSNVAIQLLSHDAYSCDWFACVQARVVAKEFCGTLYVETSNTDAAGQVVDFSNDAASNLQAGQVALLEFIATDDDAVRFDISDVSCY